MLTQVPGGPTKKEARQFSQPPPAAGVSFKYTTVNNPDDANSNEYPVVPFAPDKYDTIASIKQSVGDNANNAFGRKWMVPFTDADAQYMLRQQAQAQNANYERWLWNQYDTTDPAQAWIFQQVAPEQFEKRKQLILFQQNLATKYALLRLYGVKSEEDLMLKYLVETKQVELPKGPVWDPKQWMAAQTGAPSVTLYENNPDRYYFPRYVAGIFSPLRYVNQNQVGYQVDPQNRGDPLHHSNIPMNNQIFAGTEVPSVPYANYGKGYGEQNYWLNREVYLEADNAGISRGRAVVQQAVQNQQQQGNDPNQGGD